MPTAPGFVQFADNKLVGTFDVDGSPRHIAVDVKPSNLSLECDNVTLTYDNVAQLLGNCVWTGTAGKDDLNMDFKGGVSISGRLTAPRSSIRVRGAGAWSTVEVVLPPPPASSANVTQDNPTQSQDACECDVKVEREKLLLESGHPIIACAFA